MHHVGPGQQQLEGLVGGVHAAGGRQGQAGAAAQDGDPAQAQEHLVGVGQVQAVLQAQALLSRDQEAREHALRQLLAGADRAGHLVDQLLRLARLDPPAELLNARPVDLVALAEAGIAERLDDAVVGEHVIELQVDADPVRVRGDADLLAMALRNLIDNALRHTPPGSRVTVRVEVADGHAQLSVLDDGPGVAAKELPRLGERFHRGRDTRAEGSGLGLAIVRRIAELHGARPAFRSEPDRGFTGCLIWDPRVGIRP